MTILDDIVKYKKIDELPRQMQARQAALVRAEAALAPRPRDFVAALKTPPVKGRPAIIAEVKRASPSKGLLRHNFDPVELAETYAASGAAAISVLTDLKYFQGRLEYLSQIRAYLDKYPPKRTGAPPLLRKDFIFHPYQVYEARAAGADAILLIAAILNDQELSDLLELARSLGMTALIEVHNRAELDRVLPLKPRMLGVNNRDLRDFSVDLNTCIELRQHVPAEVCYVAESGIHTGADTARLAAAGIDAILVGEALVKAKKPGQKLRELLTYA